MKIRVYRNNKTMIINVNSFEDLKVYSEMYENWEFV
jgi:hypothetical protein